VAVLLVSEIFGNSVRHSGSGAPGETVAVIAGDGVAELPACELARNAAGTCRAKAAIVHHLAGSAKSQLRETMQRVVKPIRHPDRPVPENAMDVSDARALNQELIIKKPSY
jgi:hypothetical protein